MQLKQTPLHIAARLGYMDIVYALAGNIMHQTDQIEDGDIALEGEGNIDLKDSVSLIVSHVRTAK